MYVLTHAYNNNSTWAEDRGKLTAEDKNGCTLETTRSFVWLLGVQVENKLQKLLFFRGAYVETQATTHQRMAQPDL